MQRYLFDYYYEGNISSLTFLLVKDDRDILWIPVLDIISSCFI